MPVISSQGATAWVYRFAMYDIRSDAFVESQRWATQSFIQEIGARQLGAGAEVDSKHVDAEGRTSPGFDPQ